MKVALLTWLLSFPPWHGDSELPEERLERLSMVADQCASAIDNARCKGAWNDADWCKPAWDDSPQLLGAALVTLWLFESRGARHIHAGRCRLSLGECDPYLYRGRLVAGSISPWQFKLSPTVHDLWADASASASDPTPVATFAACLGAARTFSRGYNGCGRSLEGAFARYARGNACHWSGAGRRADFARRLLAKTE